MNCLLVLVAAAVAVSGNDYNGFQVTFGISNALKNNEYYFDMPRSREEAEASDKWSSMPRPTPETPVMPDLVMYCQENCAVCPLYDPKSGHVAGLQLALPVDSFVSEVIPKEQRFVKWSAPAIGEAPAREYWTNTQYFVTEDELNSGNWPQDKTQTLNSGGVWVNDLDNNLIEISTKEEEIAKTIYTKQNCVQNMGTHYFYNMTESMPCEKMMPWFGLYKDGELQGTGFQIVGTLTSKKGLKEWTEAPPTFKLGLQILVPLAPQCVFDWANDYGLVSIHVYYIDKPWQITCDHSKDSVKPVNALEQVAINAAFNAGSLVDNAKKLLLG